MCMEDIRLGRKTPTLQHAVSVGTTPVLLCAGALSRTRLVVSAPSSDILYLSATASAPVAEGLAIHSGTLPIVLRIEDLGLWVQGPIYAAMSSGTQTIGIIECVLGEK